MKMTMNFSQFMDNWPESRKGQFSYDALKAIFDYLEEYEKSTDEQLEFDPIAICCDFSEYSSAYEAMKEYQPQDMPMEGEEGDDLTEIAAKEEAAALEWLQDHTQVIELENGGVVIQQF